jgi:hypothetical protein
MSSPDRAIHTFANAAEEFTQAWRNPRHTRITLPPVDVNKVIAERYRMGKPTQITRGMVWDMELKKSWDPRTYISYVVSEGKSWGRRRNEDGSEHFCRSTIQRAWIDERSGRVLEDVYINHQEQRILFLGRSEMVTEDGERIRTDGFQPLFHVEHAAGGTDAAPLNMWRIALLTEAEDRRFMAPFEKMIRDGLLPGFLEIYIDRDLGVKLSRR